LYADLARGSGKGQPPRKRGDAQIGKDGSNPHCIISVSCDQVLDASPEY
jgi:hypothetical protein